MRGRDLKRWCGEEERRYVWDEEERQRREEGRRNQCRVGVRSGGAGRRSDDACGVRRSGDEVQISAA